MVNSFLGLCYEFVCHNWVVDWADLVTGESGNASQIISDSAGDSNDDIGRWVEATGHPTQEWASLTRKICIRNGM
jgi:hypothetical protein